MRVTAQPTRHVFENANIIIRPSAVARRRAHFHAKKKRREAYGSAIQTIADAVASASEANKAYNLLTESIYRIEAVGFAANFGSAFRRAQAQGKDEAGAIEEMFTHYEELGFLGGMLYQNGEPVAFTAGTKLDNEVFDTHFEKALPGVEGAYTMVNREFARLVRAEYPDIEAFNREEDMGIEGLRKAKLSYHPDILLMKYYAEEK